MVGDYTDSEEAGRREEGGGKREKGKLQKGLMDIEEGGRGSKRLFGWR